MYFSSKRDTWIGLLLWIPIIAGFVLTTWIPLTNGQYYPTGTFIFVPIVAFVAWLWFGTGYRVTDDELKIKCGPIRQTIPLLKSSKFFPKNPKLVSQISLITTLGTHLFRRIRL
jgi:hypothetical protein